MRQLLNFAVVVAVLSLGDAYSKYGRTCKDIGCPANQMCVILEDPCTSRSKPNQCGKYPTCRRVSNAAASCASYVCPPTMSCKMDRGVPKCFASNGRSSRVPDISNYPQKTNQGPSYPQYPNYQSRGGYGQTTSRPYIYQPGQHVSGGGYQGGVIGSGYPGQGGYSRQGGGYTNYPSGSGYGQTTPRPYIYQPGQPARGGGYQGGVIGSGYPGQGGYSRQGNGYPTQGSGYPQQTHQQGRYSTQQRSNGYSGQAYPAQSGYINAGQGGGYPSYGQSRYQQTSGQDTLLNSLTKILKTNFNIDV